MSRPPVPDRADPRAALPPSVARLEYLFRHVREDPGAQFLYRVLLAHRLADIPLGQAET